MRQSSLVPAAVVILGAASLLIAAGAGQNPPAKPAVQKALLEERRDAARNVFDQGLLRLKGAEALPEGLSQWSLHWLDAELALCETRGDRVAALEAHVKRAKEVEDVAAHFAKIGQGRDSDAHAARYFRIDAEIRLLEARAQAR